MFNSYSPLSGFFSVWRTPLNTIYVKVSTNNYSFRAGKSIIENLHYDMANNEIPLNIYNKSSNKIEIINVKKRVKTKIKLFFESIVIPNVISATTIFAHTIELVKKDLKRFYILHFKNNNNKVFEPSTTFKKVERGISLNDIGAIIKEVEEKLGSNYFALFACT